MHADDREPFYFLGGGLQDNGNWLGPNRTREPQGILTDDWRLVSYGDGYYQTSHPEDPDLIVSESQGGWIFRTDMRTLEQQVNAADLPEDQKVKLQSYITGCYGTLTSFNVLFSEEEDQFKGAASD